MNNKKIAQTTILVTIVIIISKITGFLRDVALAYAFGTSASADAYVLALSATAIFGIVFVAAATSFTPIYQEYTYVNELPDILGRNKYVHSIYSIFGMVTVACAAVGVLASELVVSILAPGFGGLAHTIAVSLTQILMLMLPLTFIMTISGQQLRAEGKFILPLSFGMTTNFILIVTLVFLCPTYGIYPLAWASVAGALIPVLFQGISLWRLNYHFRFHFDLHNKGIRRTAVLIMPILLGSAIQTVNTIVDRVLASGLAEGSVAALNFSNKLALFIISLVSLGAGNICFVKMSELGASKKYEELKVFLRRVINMISIIVIPATVGLIVLNQPIVQAVFEYGAFGGSSRQMTATALIFYSVGLLGYALRDIITRAFYSIQDTKTPMINGIFAVIINVAGNIILVKVMGIGGLALATSISAIVGTILLLYSLRKKVGRLGMKEMAATFLKTGIAALAMGVAVYYIYGLFFSWIGIVPIALLISICLGMMIYGVLLLFMKIKEVEFIKAYVLRRR